jgi:hypothetical protein
VAVSVLETVAEYSAALDVALDANIERDLGIDVIIEGG